MGTMISMSQLFIRGFNLLYRLRARLEYFRAGLPGVMHYLKFVENPEPILRAFGAEIGAGTVIYPGLVIHAAERDFSNLKIGKACRIGRECFLDLTNRINIEDTANIGMRSMLITHVNVAQSPLRLAGLETRNAPIRISRGAVTFSGVTVLMGVTLGECAVAGAGAVVSSDVPAHSMVVGNPARVIKRFETPNAAPVSNPEVGEQNIPTTKPDTQAEKTR
jgi:acetyltransferase-like isoleucine patch superfamily enzyme